MKGFRELQAEKINLQDGRKGYFFASSGSAPAKIKVLVKDGIPIGITKRAATPGKRARRVVGKGIKGIRAIKRVNDGTIVTVKKKKKEKTPEFKILSQRLTEATKLKASGKYHDRDFDKLIDAL